MPGDGINGVIIRHLGAHEVPPYELLLDADPSQALVDKYLPLSDVWIAELAGNVIGVYVLYPVDLDIVELKNIAVHEKYQGKGIGKMMLKDAATHARTKGFKRMIVGTANSSVGQLYLYQKVGFEITGIIKDFFVDNYSDALFENGIRVRHMIMLQMQL